MMYRASLESERHGNASKTLPLSDAIYGNFLEPLTLPLVQGHFRHVVDMALIDGGFKKILGVDVENRGR